MDKKVKELLNEQVTAEFYAAQLYLSMSAYFANEALDGFAAWMRAQYEEECEHALKIFDHLLERGESVELGAIEQPKLTWSSPLEAASDALDHEKKVTAMIHNIMKEAVAKDDYATITLMNWYVDEQVEEEDSVGAIVDHLKMAGDSPSAVFMVDRSLSNREE